MDVLRLIRYNHFLWRRFSAFYENEMVWAQLSQNHESSHQSVANVTMHAVNMEDWWLHYVVPGKKWDGPRWDSFQDAASMRRRVDDVAARTESLLRGVTSEELRRPITVDAGGGAFRTTLEDVLAEVVNEETHHRGEVLAMLWRMDVEPPYVGFLDWAREHERA